MITWNTASLAQGLVSSTLFRMVHPTGGSCTHTMAYLQEYVCGSMLFGKTANVTMNSGRCHLRTDPCPWQGHLVRFIFIRFRLYTSKPTHAKWFSVHYPAKSTDASLCLLKYAHWLTTTSADTFNGTSFHKDGHESTLNTNSSFNASPKEINRFRLDFLKLVCEVTCKFNTVKRWNLWQTNSVHVAIGAITLP